MKCAEEYMRLYAVTDRAWVGGQTLYQQVESALKGGVTCVQLREKELDEEAFLKEAFELHDLCKNTACPFSSTITWTSPSAATPRASMWGRRIWPLLRCASAWAMR